MSDTGGSKKRGLDEADLGGLPGAEGTSYESAAAKRKRTGWDSSPTGGAPTGVGSPVGAMPVAATTPAAAAQQTAVTSPAAIPLGLQGLLGAAGIPGAAAAQPLATPTAAVAIPGLDPAKLASLVQSSAAITAAVNANPIANAAHANQILAQLSSTFNLSAFNNQRITRIYVGSLDYTLTAADITQVFSAFGTVVNVDMPKDNGRSKGFCFVEFSNPDSAEKALASMNGFYLHGRPIKVGRPVLSNQAQQQQQAAMAAAVAAATGGLLPGMGPAQLELARQLAIAAGANPGLTTQLLQQQQQQPLQQLQQAAGAALAPVGALPGQLGIAATASVSGVPGIGGSPSQGTPSAAAAPAKQPMPNVVFIGQVPISFSVDDVKQIFKVFGTIVSCQLMGGDTPGSTHRGYGFIEYAEPSEAKMAVQIMDGFDVCGKPLKVSLTGGEHQTPASAAHALAAAAGATPAAPISPPPITPPQPSHLVPTVVTAQSAGSPAKTDTSSGGQQYATPVGSAPAALAKSATTPITSGISPLGGTGEGAATGKVAAAAKEERADESRTFVATNMVKPDEVDEDLESEFRAECERFGAVESVEVNVNLEDTEEPVKIYIEMATHGQALRAVDALNGRWFGGMKIRCRLTGPSMGDSRKTGVDTPGRDRNGIPDPADKRRSDAKEAA